MKTAIHNITPGDSGKGNLLQKLVAGVASKRATIVTNGAGPVTREEFNSLTAVVASLVKDVEDATSPENLSVAFNEALKPLMNGLTTVNNGSRGPFGEYRVPSDDDDDGAPAKKIAGKPTYKLPEGD